MNKTIPVVFVVNFLIACTPGESPNENSTISSGSTSVESMESANSLPSAAATTTDLTDNTDESEVPVVPEQSSEPFVPVVPELPPPPEMPTSPVEPEIPTEPETPTTPEEPTNPDEPDEPAEPTTSEQTVTENLALHPSKHAAKLIVSTSTDISSRPALSGNLSAITKELYQSFHDEFDFIFLLSNYEVTPPGFDYAGIFFGVGSPSVYGSAGKLKGVIHFPSIRGIKFGPALHEIGHQWSGHKGFTCFSSMTPIQTSDGRGVLGGCAGDSLQPEPGSSFTEGGLFTADNFGLVANGGNSVPFNGAELFEMGFISKAQAGDVWVIDNPADAISSVPGKRAFTADKITKMAYADYNADEPDVTPNTHQIFRILTVLIDNSNPSDANFDTVADDASWFSLSGDDGIQGLYNFNEATHYLGTVITADLDKVLK